MMLNIDVSQLFLSFYFSSKLFLMIILGLLLTAHTTGRFLPEPWPHMASLELIHIKGYTTYWIKSGR